MPFINTNGLTVRYDLRGPADAPVVMLSHSIGTAGAIWDEVADALADRYRVLCYDLRGHGLSDVTPGPYTIAGLAEDSLARLDALAIERVHFCGVSLGGMIGQHLGARAPQRVASVALFDTATRIGTAEGWHERAAATRNDGLETMAYGLLDLWFTTAFSSAQPGQWCGYRNMLCRTPAEGYAGACEAIAEADLEADAGAIGCPALVAVGAEDVATTSDDAGYLAGLIDGARLRIIDGSAHLPPVEQPQATARVLRAFYDEVTA